MIRGVLARFKWLMLINPIRAGGEFGVYGEITMLQASAARHQIVLPEQRELYDYWRSKCVEGKIPTREDINPVDIAQFLPTLSLVQPIGEGDDRRYQYRLAGTKFWDVYHREITGDFIDNLPEGSRRDYWARVLGRVIERGRPSAGVQRMAVSGRTHMAQFWVRLPLASDGVNVDMILGFDKFVKLSETSLAPVENTKIYA